jgi:hypothetical protein
MFMPDVIVAMLSAHLERAGFTKDDSDELVFTDEEGGPLRYSNWRRRVWLQTRLGHADPRTTLAVYASAPASIDRVAADIIGDRFFGPRSKKTQEPRNLNETTKSQKSPRHLRAIRSGGLGPLRSLSL